MLQTTIAKNAACCGIGLHSGEKVNLVLRPAPADTGILFTVQTGQGRRILRPQPEAVVSTALATTLGHGADAISTVEHLLAALAGMGVDNVVVDVEGGELPIMDGSAASFVYLIRQAGVKTLNVPRTVMSLTKPVELVNGDKYVKGEPYRGFFVDYTVDFGHPLIGRQRMALEITPQAFVAKIAKARTFGFLNEVEKLRQMGLAKGGSLDNAVVLDEYSVVNAEGLRYKDEFVRHKILDFIGDMAMLGAPLWGRFTIFASGHALNNAFLRMIHGQQWLEPVVLADKPRAHPQPIPAGLLTGPSHPKPVVA